MKFDVAMEIEKALETEEVLLWSDTPCRHFYIDENKLAPYAFGLLWSGFFGFCLYGTDPSNGQATRLWAGIFPLLGVILPIGDFFWSARVRASTAYALTNHRVVLLRSWPRRRITSLPVDLLSDVTLTDLRDGIGIITFGPAPTRRERTGKNAQRRFGNYVAPEMNLVPDADEVYRLILQAHWNTGK